MSDPLTIREAAADDLTEVLRLARGMPGAPLWSDQAYAELIAGPSAQSAVLRTCLVLTQGGRLIGLGVMSIVRAVSPAEAELESILVAGEFQRQGFGGILLRGLLEWVAAQGAGCTRLEVRASNKVALSLYERHGFVREGMRRLYYRDPAEDAVLMVHSRSDTFA